MKLIGFFLPVLFTFLFSFTSHAELKGAPFGPAGDARFNELEKGKLNVLKAVYDVSSGLHSGTSGATVNLGVYLPAKALIVRSYIYVVTQLVDGGTGTLAFQCEDANNIKTATDMTGTAAAGFIEGQSTGAASAFKAAIGSRCQMQAVVAGATISAGKLDVYVEYMITD